MNRILGGIVAAAVLVCSAAQANLLVNSSFEDPITFNGPPFVGSWEGFSSGPGAVSANSLDNPRTGLQSLHLAITNTNNAFAGAFQDVVGLTAGNMATFSAWMMTDSAVVDLTIEMRIEWRNSISNTEVSRTPNLNPVLNGVYQEIVLNSQVPVGADTARVVFAVQSFSPEPTNTGSIYLDDAAFVEVPGPGALAAAGSLLGLVATRRRRAV